MKIKELQKTVNLAWSPAQHQTILLAAGTAAQNLDLASSAAAVLEVYDTNLTESGYDLVLKGSQVSQHRFHKIVWSPLGIGGQYADGVIVAGCESGHLQVYNAARLLAGEDAIMSTQTKHTGAVRALDFNPFQTNLLASGAAESEILIWDLNNTTTPMMPGTKTQPAEDIQSVGWNQQVQHILASVFSSRCIVWDLRKNEPIIKLSDSQSRVRWRSLQWHPEIATQLWLASEDDQAPVVQLWDLRYATAPAKTVQMHHRGVLGLAWCPRDPDLMVSCGKDNKIIAWNPNSATAGDEFQSEVASTIHWYSDVQWCPKNPALIASSSLDGNVSVYSLFGGNQQQVQTSDKIADSFPGMDTFAQAPVPQQSSAPVVYHDLRTPPVWMKRPVGAKFVFGGKLATFNATSKQVTLSQVITETELVERSVKLEDVLATGNFEEYCRLKADQMPDQHGRYVWYFLKANFDADPRREMLNLLGYNAEDMAAKFAGVVSTDADEAVDHLTKEMSHLSRAAANNVDAFDAIAADQGARATSEIPYKISTGDDTESLIGQAILTGRTEVAVELCFKDGRYADAIIIAMTGGSELLSRTQFRYLQRQQGYLSNIISALVTEDWSGVVTQCTTDSWKEALAATLTHAKEQMPVLCERLAERLQSEVGNESAIESAILCYICAGNIEKLVESWPSVERSIGDLQELVEIVMLLQKALELQGRNVGASGKLAELLARYAGLLAAQGALSSALTYLGPSEDATINDLRERLYFSLGHKQAYAQGGRQSNAYQSNQPNNQNARLPQRNSIPNNNAVAPQASFNSAFANQVPAAFAQPFQQQPPQVYQPPTNNAWNAGPNPPISSQPPARPPSVGPPTATNNTASRSKYLRDPSVQPGPTGYGTTGTIYTPQTPFANNNNNHTNTYPTQPPAAAYAPMVPAAVPFNNNNPLPPVNNFAPFTPAAQPGGDYLSGVPPIEMATPALATQRNRTPPPGWNDPPALKTNARKPPSEQLYYPSELCNHHEMSAEHAGTRKWARLRTQRARKGGSSDKEVLPPTVNLDYTRQTGTPTGGNQYANNGIYDPNAQHASPYASSIMTPQQPAYQPQPPFQPANTQYAAAAPPAPTATYNNFPPPAQSNAAAPPQPFQPQFATSVGQPPAQHQHQAPAQRLQTPEPPRAKEPLPEEFVYLQTVFNELKTQCSTAAGNPQTRRKLDDVAKRLESLYDLLRANRLTPNTLDALNQLVQLVQTGDYANGLLLHTQMVSGPDFAQIASFMPGIKTLLQIALQCQVYLR